MSLLDLDLDYRDMPRLWDADPDVCCAAFQLGACPHTEDYDEDDDETADTDLAARPCPPVAPFDEEPF